MNNQNLEESVAVKNIDSKPKVKNINLGLIISLLILSTILLLGGLTVFLQTASSKFKSPLSNIIKSNTAQDCIRIIESKSINTIPEDKKGAKTCKEAVDSLGDEYSTFFTKSDYDKFINGINNTYSGIGVAIGELKLNETETVINITKVFEGTPAQANGLKLGDIIQSIDGVSTTNIKTDAASSKIRGEEGTVVKLKIKSGEIVEEKSITRKKVNIPTVETTKVDNVGLIGISSFSMNLYDEFRTKTSDFQKDPAINTIVLDLRNNPGGSLDSAIDIIGAFTPKGTHAVTEVLKNDKKKLYTNREPLFNNKKLIIFQNENSASASEIATITLKEKANAKIVGAKSFGKGVVQQLIDLPDGDVMKLTIAEWESPSGYRINKKGIMVDQEYKTDKKLSDPEVIKYINEIK
jgi:carboxyl-terminal processing protease